MLKRFKRWLNRKKLVGTYIFVDGVAYEIVNIGFTKIMALPVSIFKPCRETFDITILDLPETFAPREKIYTDRPISIKGDNGQWRAGDGFVPLCLGCGCYTAEQDCLKPRNINSFLYMGAIGRRASDCGEDAKLWEPIFK